MRKPRITITPRNAQRTLLSVRSNRFSDLSSYAMADSGTDFAPATVRAIIPPRAREGTTARRAGASARREREAIMVRWRFFLDIGTMGDLFCVK